MISQFQFFPVDSLSFIMGSLALLLLPLILIYSVKYIRTHHIHYFIPFFILALGIIGVFFSKDFLGFFVFLELVTLSSYFLIIQPWMEDTLAAGFKYLIMNLIGGVLILFSVLILYSQTGSFDFIEISKLLSVGAIGKLPLISIAFLLGCLIKCGAIPFHTWLPDAHPAAPSPISALLSGLVINIGVYGILRFMFTLKIFFPVLVWIGVGSMLFGVILALRQTNIKRLLAYSSISQMGYILLGIGIGGGLGLGGGIFHAINHAVFKMLLFLCAGAVIYVTGERQLKHLGGLMTRMPVTAAFFIIGALSISGIPPFNGFVSKSIISAAVVTGREPMIKIAMILTAAGTFALFFKMFKQIFLGDLSAGKWNVKEAPVIMLFPMFLLASACLGMGVMWRRVLVVFIYPVLGQYGANTVLSVHKIWSLESLLHTLIVIGLGLVIYGVGMRMGWLGSAVPWIFSVDRIYVSIGRLIVMLGNIIRDLQFRSLNFHLLWVFLMLLLFYFLFRFIA